MNNLINQRKYLYYTTILFLYYSISLILTQGHFKQTFCLNSGIYDDNTNVCLCNDHFSNSIVHVRNSDENNPNVQGCSIMEQLDKPIGIFNDMCTKTKGVNDTTTGCLDGMVCDTTYHMHLNKNIQCNILDGEISDFAGDKMTLQCRNTSEYTEILVNNKYDCDMQFWDTANKPEEVFYCKLYNCKPNNNKEGIEYACEKSECHCTHLSAMCDKDVEFVIDGMKEDASLLCDKNMNCRMKHKNFPMEIKIKCIAGECVEDGTIIPNKEPPYDILHDVIVYSIVTIVIGSLMVLCTITGVLILFEHVYLSNKLANEKHNQNKENENLSVSVKDLNYYASKYYFVKGKKILENINLDINNFGKHKFIAIIGDSGSGKTTLLDIITKQPMGGFITGSVKYNNKRKVGNIKRLVTYNTQSDFFRPNMTVSEMLDYVQSLKGGLNNNRDNLIEQLGIGEFKDVKIGDVSSVTGNRGISGGQRKKLSIACSLLSDSKLIVLDEPMSGLDDSSTHAVIKTLSKAATDSKHSRMVVITIHQPDDRLFSYFDRVIVMKSNGTIFWDADKNDLISQLKSKKMISNEFDVYKLKDDEDNQSISSTLLKLSSEYDMVATKKIKGKKTFIIDESSMVELDEFKNKEKLLKKNFINENENENENENNLAGKFSFEDENGIENFLDDEENEQKKGKKIDEQGKKLNKIIDQEILNEEAIINYPDYESDEDEDDIDTIRKIFLGKRKKNFFKDNLFKRGVFALSKYSSSVLKQLFILYKLNLKLFIRDPLLGLSYIIISLFTAGFGSFIYWDLGSNKNFAASQNRIGALFLFCLLTNLCSLSSIPSFIEEKSIFIKEMSEGYYRPSVYYFVKMSFDAVMLRCLPTILSSSILYFSMWWNPSIQNFVIQIVMLSLFNIMAGLVCNIIASLSSSTRFANIVAVIVIVSSSVFAGFMINLDTIPGIFTLMKYCSYWFPPFNALVISEFLNTRITIDAHGFSSFVTNGKFVLDNLGIHMEKMPEYLLMTIIYTLFIMTLSGIVFVFTSKPKK